MPIEVPSCAAPDASVKAAASRLCCVHAPALRVKIHTAPALLLLPGPPIAATYPSAEKASEVPCFAAPVAPVPATLLPDCDQVLLLRVKVQKAPALELSPGPPIRTVLPSPEIATALPSLVSSPAIPVPNNLPPCCVQVAPLRVKIHAAPSPPSSLGPPMTAVFPSEEIATSVPWFAPPVALAAE